MSTASKANQHRVTLRSTGGLWIFGTMCAFGLFLIIDALARGGSVFLLSAAPWMLAVLWLAYALLVRPCVVVTAEELRIVNVLRIHHLPWAHIADMTTRYQLKVLLDDGRQVSSWGAPSVGVDRPSVIGATSSMYAREQYARASGVRRHVGRSQPSVTSAQLIELARKQWTPQVSIESTTPGHTVSTRWDWWLLTSGAALALLSGYTLLR